LEILKSGSLIGRRIEANLHEFRACPMAPGPGPGHEPPMAPIGHVLVFPGQGPGPMAPIEHALRLGVKAITKY
jgi:hypothetical protein